MEPAPGGDPTALRLGRGRIAPPSKDAPAAFDAPEMKRAADAVQVIARAICAIVAGDLTQNEGTAVAAPVETCRRTRETTQLEARTAALEACGGRSC